MPSLREIPQPVIQAIEIAPTDPLGTNGPVTIFARNVVDGWTTNDGKFKTGLTELGEHLTEKQQNALNLYLWSQAITLARHSYSSVEQISDEEKAELESQKGKVLFNYLVDPKTDSETEAHFKTDKHPHKADISRLIKPKKKKDSSPVEYQRTGFKPLADFLKSRITEFKKILDKDKRPPEIREYIEILKEAQAFAKKSRITNPPLWDFIIGNIKMTRRMEPKYDDVYDRMGFVESVKWNRMKERSDAYEIMLGRADVNYTGYQDLGRGWPALRGHFESYLKRYNLDCYVHRGKIDGTFITEGATDAFLNSYLLARHTLRREQKDMKFNPRILFPTPGFTMLAKLGNALDMEAKEIETSKDRNFFLDPEKLKKFLSDSKNDDILIIDLQFINNPTTTIVPPKQLKQVMDVISKHRGRNDSRIIVINDGAYLGMTIPQKQETIRENGAILNEYKRRIDVLPMTKIFGRPALRCGFVGTPDEQIAEHIPSIIKLLTPSVSYAIMKEALPMWDYIKFEDQQRFFEMLHERQEKLLGALAVRNDVFDLENSYISHDESDDLAAFYLYVPVKDSVDPLFIPAMTGLFGNLDATFYLDRKTGKKASGKKYLRLAVGMEPLDNAKLDKLKKDLHAWKKYPLNN